MKLRHCVLFFLLFPTMVHASHTIHVGVFAFNNAEYALKSWQPTFDYLEKSLPGYHFVVKAYQPESSNDLKLDMAQKNLDFVITQPLNFVELQAELGATSLLTLEDQSGFSEFGSVIFTRADNQQVQSLNDIKHMVLAGASPVGLGGWLIGLHELDKKLDQSPLDFNQVMFLGVQENIVEAVLNSKADVGVVRTGFLEGMVENGRIDLGLIKVINPIKKENFPYFLSTETFPEWALVKAPHTSTEIAKAVSVALLQLPKMSAPAQARGYSQWITAIDYQPVHALMKRLNVGIYSDHGKIAFWDYIRSHWLTYSVIVLLVFALVFSALRLVKLNRQIRKAKTCIENQYDRVLNSVSEGIFGLDLEGNCTFTNRAFISLLGWDSSELSKQTIEALQVQHGAVVNKQGMTRHFESSSSPVLDEQQNLMGKVIVLKDITEKLKQIEQEKTQQKEIEFLSRLNTMNEMVTGISHELNQPLTSIQTTAFALHLMVKNEQISRDKLMESLDSISKQAEFSASIIQQLRQMLQKNPIVFEKVDLNAHVHRVLSLLKNEINTYKIEIKLDLATTLKPVNAQPTQIDQVILNLCKNAIEALKSHNTENGYFLIESVQHEDGAELRFTDNGSGISLELQKDLFTPFISSKNNGLGLGLSISRSIIEQHYGRLFLQASRPGYTEFRLMIPYKEVLE
jgi:nitrogen-specific signal transduction histidine kinase/ABC-type phosphate/phosphonate transport system substrate-binding protein